MDIIWTENQPPKCVHPLTSPEQIDGLVVPHPSGGLNAKRIEWYHAMVDANQNIEVTLNGHPLEVTVTLSQPGGPIPSAFALAGANLFLWMAMEPERVHTLMQIVTESHMNCVRFFDEMMGRELGHPTGLGCDAAEMVSADMFREFVVPYYLKIWKAYPGPRGFHNCGQNEHLLDLIKDELQITSHNGFGFCVDPAVLAEKMSGCVVLRGGPDPFFIKSESRDNIGGISRKYITMLGMHGGFILSCGGGAALGTPIDNYHALVEASMQLGCVMKD